MHMFKALPGLCVFWQHLEKRAGSDGIQISPKLYRCWLLDKTGYNAVQVQQ